MSRRLLVLVALGVWLIPSAVYADVITEWNTAAIRCVKEDKVFVAPASRALAIMHLAMYDAVNGITRKHQPFHVTILPIPGASPEAAAASAAYRVLVTVYPDQKQHLDELLASSLSSIPDGINKENGLRYGLLVADEMLRWRGNDGATHEMVYQTRATPGYWQPTPPKFGPPTFEQWATLIPFAMTSDSQFRPAPPPKLDSEEYAKAVNEVQAIGGKESAVRTPYQSETAVFWADPVGTDTTAGRWNRIAQQVSAQHGYTLEQNARLFALLNVAMADAAIVAWDCKYTSNYWRPVTAIRNADKDNNPLTTPDSNWESYITTPSFPEYMSGHATFSGAASAILIHEFGDENEFTVPPYLPPATPRTYGRFSDAAMEGAMSRLYGGIHYRFSSMMGLQCGRDLGEYVWGNFFRPIGREEVKRGGEQ